MPIRISSQVDTRRLNRIIKNLPGATEATNRKIAFEIEARAKVYSPIDTGANRSSIHTITSKSSNFARAAADAHGKRPEVSVQPAPTPRGTDAHVGAGMEYSAALEYGSRGRSGRPYLGRAVNEVADGLAHNWRGVFDSL